MKNFKCPICRYESNRFYLGTEYIDEEILNERMYFEVEIQPDDSLKLIGPAPGYTARLFKKLNMEYWSNYIQKYLDEEFNWNSDYPTCCPKCGREIWIDPDEQEDN